jgi:PPOX class probable F420-dependent enzyme
MTVSNTMSADEVRSFLAYGTRTAKIATVRADGRPHVVPIWFVLDGDDIVFTTGARTTKAAAMRHQPRVALCVDDETPPFAYVTIEGTATLIPDAPDVLAWATRIAARYMGAGLAEAYGRRNAVPGEALVRVTPMRIIAEKDVAE